MVFELILLLILALIAGAMLTGKPLKIEIKHTSNNTNSNASITKYSDVTVQPTPQTLDPKTLKEFDEHYEKTEDPMKKAMAFIDDYIYGDGGDKDGRKD